MARTDYRIGDAGELPRVGFHVDWLEREDPHHRTLVEAIRWRHWNGDAINLLAAELDCKIGSVSAIVSGHSCKYGFSGPVKGMHYEKQGGPLYNPMSEGRLVHRPDLSKHLSAGPPSWLGEFQRRSIPKLTAENVEKLRWLYHDDVVNIANKVWGYKNYHQFRRELMLTEEAGTAIVRGAKKYRHFEVGPIVGHHYSGNPNNPAEGQWTVEGVNWEVDQDRIDPILRHREAEIEQTRNRHAVGPNGELPHLGRNPRIAEADVIAAMRWRAWSGDRMSDLAREVGILYKAATQIIRGVTDWGGPYLRTAGGPIRGLHYKKNRAKLKDCDPSVGPPPPWLIRG